MQVWTFLLTADPTTRSVLRELNATKILNREWMTTGLVEELLEWKNANSPLWRSECSCYSCNGSGTNI